VRGISNNQATTISFGNNALNVNSDATPFAYNDKWKQIVLVLESGVQRIYINGMYYNMNTPVNLLGNLQFRIGMNLSDVSNAGFALDDLILYNRALTHYESWIKQFTSKSTHSRLELIGCGYFK